MIIMLLLVIGGAIVNVAVAWGLALRLPPQQLIAKYAFIDDMQLLVDRQAGSRYVYASQSRDIDERFDRVEWPVLQRELPPFSKFQSRQWIAEQLEEIRLGTVYAQIGEHAHGWPLLSLRCDFRIRFTTPNTPVVEFNGGLESDGRYKRVIPYHPIWPGFAINTIFYAAILWVVFFVPGKVKRTLRRRRGMCPACAYPIGTSPVCTECGATVKSKRDEVPQ